LIKKWALYIGLVSGTQACYLTEKRKTLGQNHHQLAASLMEKCDYNRALSHLLKGTKVDSKNFLMRHTLAVVYFTIKDYNSAIKELKKVLKQNPKITEARLTLARSYLELGHIQKAIREIHKAENDPTYAHPLKIIALKGLAYFKQGEILKARKEFKEYLSVPKQENCFITLHLGKTEMALNRLKEAESIFKKSVQVCTNERSMCKKQNYDSHFFLAEIYFKKKWFKKAAYHYKIFLKQASAKNPYISQAKNKLKQI